ncbi:hypothetical protein D5047_08745 [Verminephrobacter eiseniae]|nr:hypothetical protein [Verminephrobacter eiseniae]
MFDEVMAGRSLTRAARPLSRTRPALSGATPASGIGRCRRRLWMRWRRRRGPRQAAPNWRLQACTRLARPTFAPQRPGAPS